MFTFILSLFLSLSGFHAMDTGVGPIGSMTADTAVHAADTGVGPIGSADTGVGPIGSADTGVGPIGSLGNPSHNF